MLFNQIINLTHVTHKTFPPPLAPPPGAGSWIMLYVFGNLVAKNIQMDGFLPFSPAAGEEGGGMRGKGPSA